MSVKTNHRRMARVTRQEETFADMGLTGWRVFDENGIGHVVWTLGARPEGWARAEVVDG